MKTLANALKREEYKLIFATTRPPLAKKKIHNTLIWFMVLLN